MFTVNLKKIFNNENIILDECELSMLFQFVTKLATKIVMI